MNQFSVARAFLLLWIALLIPGICGAEGPFKDPLIEGKLSAVYRVQTGEDKAPYFRYITRVKKEIDGEDFQVMYLREEIGVEIKAEIEAVSAVGSLRPIYAARLDKGELVYKVNFYDDHADVFIPKEKAEKSQSVVPGFFKRILGIGREEEKDDSADPVITEELGEAEKKQEFALPSEKIFTRIREYKEKEQIVPSKDTDTQRRVELPEDVYALQNIAAAFETFPFGEKKKVSFNLSYLPHPMVIWEMKLTLLEEEDVTVPAGTFRCYKLGMETHEWWSFFALRTDNTYWWMKKDPPHIFVKYTYPFADRFVELVSYTIDSGENFE